MTDCVEELIADCKPHPRVCPICNLGPCQRKRPDGTPYAVDLEPDEAKR